MVGNGGAVELAHLNTPKAKSLSFDPSLSHHITLYTHSSSIASPLDSASSPSLTRATSRAAANAGLAANRGLLASGLPSSARGGGRRD